MGGRKFFTDSIIMHDLIGALAITAIFFLAALAVYRRGEDEPASQMWAFLAKGAVIAFILGFLAMYFVVNGPRKEMLDNAIRRPPEF